MRIQLRRLSAEQRARKILEALNIDLPRLQRCDPTSLNMPRCANSLVVATSTETALQRNGIMSTSNQGVVWLVDLAKSIAQAVPSLGRSLGWQNSSRSLSVWFNHVGENVRELI